ncbi:MAG: YraN family protein [Prevotella sp.]|nr:YraN family protein [Prevotella sp.]
MARHNEIGKWGEDVAAAFLQEKGYAIVERDWRSGHRDLDLVARDGDRMVFVEVKTRQDGSYASPAYTLNQRKLSNVAQAIHHYIHTKNIVEDFRVDIIIVAGSPGKTPEITHLEDVRIL